MRGRPRKHFEREAGDIPNVVSDGGDCGNCGNVLSLDDNNHTFKTKLFKKDLRDRVSNWKTITVADALTILLKVNLGESLNNTPICPDCLDILRNLHTLWNSFIQKTSETSILHSIIKEHDGGSILPNPEPPTRRKLRAKICRLLATNIETDHGIKKEEKDDDHPNLEVVPKSGMVYHVLEGENDDIIDPFNAVETKLESMDIQDVVEKGMAKNYSSPKVKRKIERRRKTLRPKTERRTPSPALPSSTLTTNDDEEETVTKRPLMASALASLKFLREESPSAPSPLGDEKEESEDDGSDFEVDDDLEKIQIAIEKSEERSRSAYFRDRRERATAGIPKTEVCQECRRKFATTKGLKIHQQQVHGEVRGPFICDVENCGRVFDGASSLEGHKNVHFGIRPYICDQCGWTTTGERLLEIHMLTHLKPEEKDQRKTKVCEVCGAKFIRAGDLKHHMVVHSDEKPFHCSFEGCPSKFKMRTKQRLHEKEVHSELDPVDIYGCQRCGREFNRKHNWKQHMDRHEKYDVLGTKMRKSRKPPVRDKILPKVQQRQETSGNFMNSPGGDNLG